MHTCTYTYFLYVLYACMLTCPLLKQNDEAMSQHTYIFQYNKHTHRHRHTVISITHTYTYTICRQSMLWSYTYIHTCIHAGRQSVLWNEVNSSMYAFEHMCVCVYACMYVCMYHTDVCVHMCVCVCVYIYIYIYIQFCISI